ncbi:unnamed protein product, partial [Amoebophrya sp. A120]
WLYACAARGGCLGATGREMPRLSGSQCRSFSCHLRSQSIATFLLATKGILLLYEGP